MGPLTKEPAEFAKTTRDPASPGDVSAPQGMPTASMDAFGIEIPVQLQGGRTGPGGHGATDTYVEDTCTLIVFPQGAVLRSSTDLATGQHLLLKNQKTNQEVPCRVVNLRSYSKGYVEIEFLRPTPGFWGVIFPSEAPKPASVRVAPAAAPPKLDTSRLAPFGKPAASQANTPPARPAPFKDIAAKPPARAPQPVKFSAAPAAPAAVPPKTPKMPQTPQKLQKPEKNEQPLAPVAAVPAASPFAPFAKEQPVKPSSAAPHAPPPAPDPLFSAASSHAQETQPVAELTAIRSPVESTSARNDSAAAATASQNSLGSFGENEQWASLSYGESSSFQVLSTEEDHGDEFSSGAAASVQEREARRKVILIGASVAALALALGTGWFFLRRHSRNSALVAASISPVTTPAPAPEQPNLVAQPQIPASPSTEALPVPPPAPVPAPPSVNPSAQPKQTPPSTTDIVRPQPKIKAPPEIQPPPKPIEAAPKPSFKLAPSASAPGRAAVSRETPPPPAPGEEAAASPAGPAEISNGMMTDALRSGAEVPAPPPLPARTAERVGGDVKPPQLLHMVPPAYPQAAKQISVQGEVTVKASVDAAGKVTDAKAISGPVLLQQAAADAVRHWKYEPATLDGKPVPMQVIVKLKFRLN